MRFNRLLTVFLASLMLFSFASCNNTPENRTGSLNIHVSDTVSKVIGYDAEENGFDHMSHYSIQVLDSKQSLVKETDSPFALTDGEGEFVVSGLVTGTYTINATGYIYNGTDYMPIATGTATEYLGPSIDKDVIIAIDDFVDGYVESIIVDLVMPIDCIVGNAITGTLNWTISGLDEAEVFSGEETLTAEALTDGKYTLLLDEDLPGGRYLLTVSFTDAQNDVYTGVDALIAYPGLPAAGAINIDSRKPFDKPFTVTDGIGEELVVGINDGEYSSADGTFVVTFTTPLEANQVPIFTVDGVYQAVEAQDGSYTLTGLQRGVRNVSIIVYDTQKKAEAGSLSFTVNVISKPTIKPEEKPVTVSYYDLAKNLALGDNEINMGFTKDGKDVEFPYSGQWNDDNSDGEVTYDELGLSAVNGELSEYFNLIPSVGMLSSNSSNPMMPWASYPYEYITFPSSVRWLGMSASAGSGVPVESKLKAVVFNEASPLMPAITDEQEYNRLKDIAASISDPGDITTEDDSKAFLAANSMIPAMWFLYLGLDMNQGAGQIGFSEPVDVYAPGLNITEFYFDSVLSENGMMLLMGNLGKIVLAGESEIKAENGLFVGKDSLLYGVYSSSALKDSSAGGFNGQLDLVSNKLKGLNDYIGLGAALSINADASAAEPKILFILPSDIKQVPSVSFEGMSSAEIWFYPEGGDYTAFLGNAEYIGQNNNWYSDSVIDEVELGSGIVFGGAEKYLSDGQSLTKRISYKPVLNNLHIKTLRLGEGSYDYRALFGGEYKETDKFRVDELVLTKDYKNLIEDELYHPGYLFSNYSGVSYPNGPWSTAAGYPLKLVAEEGVTSISPYMFCHSEASSALGLSYEGTLFSSITLPLSLKEIGDYAFSIVHFAGDDTHMIIPENVESIGEFAFRNRSGSGSSANLKSIYIPSATVLDVNAISSDIKVYRSNDYTLEEYAAEVGITIPEGFTGGTLPFNS